MSVVVFSGNHRLDEWELRSALQRIPEVSRCLREAQVELDRQLDNDESSVMGYNLMDALTSEDSDVMADETWRHLLTELVQLSLYRRYCRLNGLPSYIITPQGDLGLLGYLSCGESLGSWLAMHVDRIQDKRHLKLVNATEGLPVLAGRRLKEYGCCFSSQEEGVTAWNPLTVSQMDLAQLLNHVADESGQKEIMHIGTGDVLLSPNQCEGLKSLSVTLSEFMERDSMLHWFRQLQAS